MTSVNYRYSTSFFLTAFYNEEVTKRAESSSVSINEKHELKSSSNRAIKSTEVHQQTHSAQYSAEVIEWQKVAKREKVESSVYRDSKTISVSEFENC